MVEEDRLKMKVYPLRAVGLQRLLPLPLFDKKAGFLWEEPMRYDRWDEKMPPIQGGRGSRKRLVFDFGIFVLLVA